MRHESLVTPDHPCEVADARLLAVKQGEGDCQPGRIGERLGRRGQALELVRRRKRRSQLLRLRQVEAQEVAGVGVAGYARDDTNVRMAIGMGADPLGGQRGCAEGPSGPAPTAT